MIIKNANIVLDDKIINGSIRVEGDIIKEISPSSISAPECEVIDADGLYLAPGVVDLHTHGSGGYDFMDGEVADISGAAKSLALHGTTTCLPTTLTCSDDDLFTFIDNFRKAGVEKGICRMPGLHLEGPYFDMIQKGAQDSRYIMNPKKEHYMKVLEKADGAIKRWSVAPELEGAMEFIDTLKDNGIMISAAHTDATYDVISEAFDHGLSLLTHFYSAMSSITRKGGFRVLGTIESGYLIDDLNLELICDGMHLPPELLKMIFKLKDPKRIIGCSDSMRGAGSVDGPSILGPKNNGTDVIIEDGIAKMPDRTCFAGSVATGDRLIRTLNHIMGMPLYDVAKIVSLQPAKLIGMDGEIGSIEVGKKADFILFDEDISIKSVFVGGDKI